MVTEKPSEPGQPKVEDVTPSCAVLSWAEPDSDGGCPLDGYVLQYQAEGSTRWMTATPEPISDTRFVVKNLLEDIGYQFRVAAQNRPRRRSA